jgi:hypothetical protein
MAGDAPDTGFDHNGRRAADTARDEYVLAWLRRTLSDGERNVREIVAEGRGAGIKRPRLGRAADALGVIRLGQGTDATWQLPQGEAP